MRGRFVAPALHAGGLPHVEEMSSVKHEYLAGEILAMAGGTPEHPALSAAVLVMSGTKLSGGRWRPYSSDLRIRVLATGLATYPDAAVICGDLERDPDSPTHVTNPTLVVEVLSPGTEDYDRGEKRGHYERIEALRDYVLVAQDRRRIEVFSRDDARAPFEHRTYEAGETASLRSLKITFGVTDLYDAAAVRG